MSAFPPGPGRLSVRACGVAFAALMLALATATAAPPGSPTTDPDIMVTVAGQHVSIDPRTGRLRPPSPREAAALAQALHKMFLPPEPPPPAAQYPDGMLSVEVPEEYMNVTWVEALPDGGIAWECGTGMASALSALGADPIDVARSCPVAGTPRAPAGRNAVEARGAATPAEPPAGGGAAGPEPRHATLTIVNEDGEDEGFNDSSTARPIGGNPGTTLGEQRLNCFRFAADIWGLALDSNVEIRIAASFDPLPCTFTGAVLGSAGTAFVFANFAGTPPFPGATLPNTWYHAALADKRAGRDLLPGAPDLRARFSSNLGRPGCLGGTNWYYGFDGRHGSRIDLVTVLLHEFAHGLGFSQFTNPSSGAQMNGLPDVYGRNVFDLSAGKTWDQMTNAERLASESNARHVVWVGPEVTVALPQVLRPGTPVLTVHSPASIARDYSVGPATFGMPLASPGLTGNLALVSDGGGGSVTDACEPVVNVGAVSGRIAVIDAGGCVFTDKVRYAQIVGATAALIVDNTFLAPPAALFGVDPGVVIPSGRISQADGNALKTALATGPVNATLGLDPTTRSGADPAGRALLHTPSPLQPGSSVSHWDPIATPNQLMEPAFSNDLSHSIDVPQDLTRAQMRDVGWFADADVDGVEDQADCEPLSDLSPTLVIADCDTRVPNRLFTGGCTLSDLVRHLAQGARNHGEFVSGVAHLANRLRTEGELTDEQKGRIQSCAAGSPIAGGNQTVGEGSGGAPAFGLAVPGRAEPDVASRAGARDPVTDRRLRSFGLRLAGPHPEQGGADLELDLAAAGRVELWIHDVRGARVRWLGRDEMPAGRHPIRWDGFDDAGRPAAAGIYFVRALGNGRAKPLRLVLLR